MGNRPGSGNRPGTGNRPDPGNRPNRGEWKHNNNNNRTIQNNFYGYGGYHGCCPYTASWWSTYPGAAWTMFGVTMGVFALNSFGTIGHFFDDDIVVVEEPIPYDYGSTVYYEGDTVYVNEQPAGTAEEYYQQASTLASEGAPEETAQTEDWLPLGVFAITAADDTNAALTVQLAVNKQGILRGNQFDLTTGTNQIVKGSVDKQTQKVAWTAGDDASVVYETGLANLTAEQSTVLVHYGKDTSEVYSLVHINEPPDDTSGS